MTCFALSVLFTVKSTPNNLHAVRWGIFHVWNSFLVMLSRKRENKQVKQQKGDFRDTEKKKKKSIYGKH